MNRTDYKGKLVTCINGAYTYLIRVDDVLADGSFKSKWWIPLGFYTRTEIETTTGVFTKPTHIKLVKLS